MQRRLCAAILVLEAIVLGLSTLVLINATHMNKSLGLSVGLGLCVLCLLTSGLLRFRWAYAIGWLIQIAAIAMAIESLTLGFLGLIFLALWVTAVRLGARIERDKATWEAGAVEPR
ncbi:MAG TPA: DUF4233 domain-containing protein [Marmoricola sp.]|nr:DUF4233 domain-containing protein [Marmoricola sp.]